MSNLPWFAEWAHFHHTRNARYGAPDPSKGESAADLEAILNAFAESGVGFEAAKWVSERFAFEAPPPRLHLKVLLKLAREEATRNPAPSAVPATKEDAERLSRECADCSGSGQAIRYRFQAKGIVVFYCLCPMGRWIESKHREANRLHWRDLADYDWLQMGRVPWSNTPDNPYRWPSECWNFEHNRPNKITDWHAIRPNIGALLERVKDVPVEPAPRRVDPVPDVYRLPGEPAPTSVGSPSPPF